MDTVTESLMAVTLARLGGVGIIHRFLTVNEQANEVLKTKRSGSIIIENPYTISPNETLADAINHTANKDVSGLLVVDPDTQKLVGILTERDLVERSVCERLVISEYLGTRRTSSNVSPSLNSKDTSYKVH